MKQRQKRAMDRQDHPTNRKSHRSPQRPQIVPDSGYKTPKKIDIIPRNYAQENYVEALYDDSKSIIVATGPAGTGKTMLATLYALRELRANEVKKIIITRPAVCTDEEHGFLPGTLTEKMAPWVIPIMDVVKEHYLPYQVEKMLADEVIEIAPLAYMRGRTLKNAIVIFDEAQNATQNQMKMVLTRLGENCKMIVTGDIRQHDRGFSDNGLKDFLARADRDCSSHVAVCRFDTVDVERHPAIEDILRMYGEA